MLQEGMEKKNTLIQKPGMKKQRKLRFLRVKLFTEVKWKYLLWIYPYSSSSSSCSQGARLELHSNVSLSIPVTPGNTVP